MTTVSEIFVGLVIRWDFRTAALSGVHAETCTVLHQDGQAPVALRTEIKPLTLDNAAGYPLGDLLTQSQADALAAYGTAMAERDETLARVADLEAQIAALQPPTTTPTS